MASFLCHAVAGAKQFRLERIVRLGLFGFLCLKPDELLVLSSALDPVVLIINEFSISCLKFSRDARRNKCSIITVFVDAPAGSRRFSWPESVPAKVAPRAVLALLDAGLQVNANNA